MTLRLDGLRVGLPGRTLVALDAEVGDGEVLTVMGPSGSGKSSLLLAIAGLLGAPFRVEGRVVVDGRDVAGVPVEGRGVGLMLQAALLYPHLSVMENVAFGVPRRSDDGGRASRRERRAVASAWLARVGLAGFEARDPATLSGGEASRVALARTMAARPRVLLLDEPFAALDPALRADVRVMVLEAARTAGLPAVLVTHDAADAAAAAGRVVRVGDGGGGDRLSAISALP